MRIGVDLGGTKIEALALDDDGRERMRRRIATPAHDAAAIVAAITALIRQIEQALSVRAAVGVATPGAVSPATGVIKNSNTTCLIGQPLRDQLSDALDRPIAIANDANCFTLSEAVDGAGRDAHVVFGVIIGTGTGGGISIDKQLLVGPHAIAGEWGHNPLPWREDSDPPMPCYCGKYGCIETYLSGPGWARHHARQHNEQLSAQQIAERAAQGEPRAQDSLQRYRQRLAKGLSSIINVLDPDAVVLGGGLSNIDALYDELPLAEYVFSDTVSTPVLRAHHGDASGVRGAAWLADTIRSRR